MPTKSRQEAPIQIRIATWYASHLATPQLPPPPLPPSTADLDHSVHDGQQGQHAAVLDVANEAAQNLDQAATLQRSSETMWNKVRCAGHGTRQGFCAPASTQAAEHADGAPTCAARNSPLPSSTQDSAMRMPTCATEAGWTAG